MNRWTRIAVVASLIFSSGCSRIAAPQFHGTALSATRAADFTLTDDTGAPWSLGGQRGKTVALFFGYTRCSDTCPVTLAKLAQAVARDGTQAEVAFVTVDPVRDTPAALHRYIAKFTGGPIIGLTGRPDQIADVEHHYHVWAAKIPGVHSGKDDYDESHSSIVYLIDRDGRERVIHNDDDSLASIAADIHTLAQ